MSRIKKDDIGLHGQGVVFAEFAGVLSLCEEKIKSIVKSV